MLLCSQLVSAGQKWPMKPIILGKCLLKHCQTDRCIHKPQTMLAQILRQSWIDCSHVITDQTNHHTVNLKWVSRNRIHSLVFRLTQISMRQDTVKLVFSQGTMFLLGIFIQVNKNVVMDQQNQTRSSAHTSRCFCVTLGELHVPAFLPRLFLDSLSQGPLLPPLPTLHRGCRGDRTPRDCGFLCLF